MAIDRRHKKTEAAIQNAFVKLVLEEGYESIKINDLIQEADVNKSTFYLHYYSLLSVAYALEDQLISEMISVWNASSILQERLESLFSFISREKRRFLAVFAIGDGRFYKKAETNFLPFFENRNSEKNEDTSEAIFLFGGFYALLREWTLSNKNKERENVKSTILKKLINTYEIMDKS